MHTYQVVCPRCSYLQWYEGPQGIIQFECLSCNERITVTTLVRVKTPAELTAELAQAKAERLAAHLEAAK